MNLVSKLGSPPFISPWSSAIWKGSGNQPDPLGIYESWKMNGWNLQPSTMKRKENDLPNLHEDMFQPLIFQGVLPMVINHVSESWDDPPSTVTPWHLPLGPRYRSAVPPPVASTPRGLNINRGSCTMFCVLGGELPNNSGSDSKSAPSCSESSKPGIKISSLLKKKKCNLEYTKMTSFCCVFVFFYHMSWKKRLICLMVEIWVTNPSG